LIPEKLLYKLAAGRMLHLHMRGN